MKEAFLISLVSYLGVLVILSIFIGKKEKQAKGFLIGGRSVPLFLIIGTTVATLIGTGSSMGAVGFGYLNGFAGALYGIGGGIGILLLGRLFGEARKYNFITLSEETAFYYGADPKIKGLVSILMYLASIGWMGAHIMGGGLYISTITGVSPLYARLIVALAFSLISVAGGYLAVVWTDTIQAIVLFIGFILMLIFGIQLAGGLGRIVDNFPQAGTSFLGLAKVGVIPGISLSLNIAVGVLATPSYRQRIYSSDSVATCKKSFYTSAVFYFLFSVIPALTGMAAYTINPDIGTSGSVFPYMAVTVLPPLIGIIALIAGTSATISSASSDAIVSVSILLKDVYAIFSRKQIAAARLLLVSRLALGLSALLALVFTLIANDIITYITYMIATIMAGLFVAILLGKYWPRATPWGGILAMIAGSTSSLIILNTARFNAFWGNPIIPSLLLALVFGVVGSLLTPAKSATQEEALKILDDERREFEEA